MQPTVLLELQCAIGAVLSSHDPLGTAIGRLNATLPDQDAYSIPAEDDEKR